MNDARQFPEAVDNSMRKELVKCEMAAKYRYEMGLRVDGDTKIDLHAGGAFAKGMEAMRRAYYNAGMSDGDALNAGVAALYATYGSFVAPPKSNKTADRMAGALAFYAQQCPFMTETLVPLTFPNGEKAIEVSFNHEIPVQHPVTGKNLTYCGRFDLLAQDQEDGGVWVVDEKTTSQMGEKWANQWPLDSQMTGYCWGVQRLLDEHKMSNLEVKGAIINGIAIRLRDYEHARFKTYREEWQIERWYYQMMRDVMRWRNAYLQTSHDQALDHQCAMYNNPCEFAPLCMSRNPERLIEGSYVVKRWNPLTRTES